MINAVQQLELANPAWYSFVAACPSATVFHHPAWAQSLAECYGYRPLVLAVVNAEGKITAGLPLMEVNRPLVGRRAVALPFSDACPPLLSKEMSLAEVIQGLHMWRRQRNWPQIEIRSALPDQPGIYAGDSFVQHFTLLESNSEQVFRRLKKTQVQQRIRKAEKAGITVNRALNWEDVRTYYDLHVRTRRRLGIPVQPLGLFRLLWERLLSQGLGFVLLAYADSRPVAGGLFLHWNRVLTYKFSASDPTYWRLRANNLLLWRAIYWGCENGCRLFDWGRTDLDDVGLRDFKSGWGSEERQLQYSVLADRPPRSWSADYSRRLLALVIQRSPIWVCRTIGELVYGHFA